MNYAEEQIKRCIASLDKAIEKIESVKATLRSAKVLSDLDKHMALYEAENIVRGI